MMVLFIMPCADVYAAETFHTNKNTTEQNHDNHQHNTTTDLCTPFCICGCCGIVYNVVFQFNTFNIQTVKIANLPKNKVYYKTVFTPYYFGEIWQPPKINA